MKAKIKTLFSDGFLKHNLIFFIGSLGIAFFNYLYYPVLGRILSVETFGEVQAIVSLFMQIGIFLTAFGFITVHIVANRENKEEQLLILTELERIALGVGVSILLILVLSSGSLKNNLHFSSSLPFIALGFLILLNVPFTFKSYFLQGHKRLLDVSIGGITFSIMKLFFSILFVYLGWKTFGAIFGYIVGQAIALLYVFRKTRKELPSFRLRIPFILEGQKMKRERTELSKELVYIGFIFMMLITVTLLYTVDVIIVRRYFPPLEAGLYSGITTIARIIYFVTASISGVLLASVKLKGDKGENRKLLLKSVLLISLIGGGCLLVFSTFPSLITTILIGRKYLAYVSLLPVLSFSMLLTSVINLIFTYQIALRDYYAIIPPLAGLFTLALLSSINHGTLLAVILDLIASNIIIIIFSIILILFRKKD